MKKLSTKWFKKWSKKAKLSNQNLLDAIDTLETGLSTADLVSKLLFSCFFGKRIMQMVHKPLPIQG